jgi:hypothetical protein
MTQTQTETQAAQAPRTAVQQASMLLKLYQLADRTAAQFVYEAGRYQPMNDTLLGSDLYKLATETTWRCSHLAEGAASRLL